MFHLFPCICSFIVKMVVILEELWLVLLLNNPVLSIIKDPTRNDRTGNALCSSILLVKNSVIELSSALYYHWELMKRFNEK